MTCSLGQLLEQISACTVCAEALGYAPRPVVQAVRRARVLVIGQAPGRKVHATGIPWDDASGRRLRSWLGVDETTFYDPDQFALVPMGFCYPGTGSSGDLPPRPECAPLWHRPLLDQLGAVELTLLLSRYALDAYLEPPVGSVTAAVEQWRARPEGPVPLPHPSPRNNRWLRRNPWFETEVLPELRRRVRAALDRP